MKRKKGHKGHKKGKKKEKLSTNTEDVQDLDENDVRQPDSNPGTESLSADADKASHMASEFSDTAMEVSTGKSGQGRVRLKIRPSLPSELKHADTQLQSEHDTSTSNPNMPVSVNDVDMENREYASASDEPIPDIQIRSFDKPSRKAGSIKIISSRGLTSSLTAIQDKHLSDQNKPAQMLGERNVISIDNERTEDSSLHRNQQRESVKSTYLDSNYNEKELNTALEVIMKVMKMDAAEPFNTPVDPVALGIPDYFDVIDSPMDFGTIRENLEQGHNYSNSADVFKDVQFIWDNCYKYNNKGDYIVDLMRRVKKNFLKCWMAAGLYTDIPSTENGTTEDIVQSQQEKPYPKGKFLKNKRRRGIDHHKIGCLCAACAMRRRRKEKEENSSNVDNQTVNDANISSKLKQEPSFYTNNLESVNTSLNVGQSPELLSDDIDEPEQGEVTEKQSTGPYEIAKKDLSANKTGFPSKNDASAPFRSLHDQNDLQDDSSELYQVLDYDTGFAMQTDDERSILQDEDGHQDHDRLIQQEESCGTLYEDSSRLENHDILHICKTLFPEDQRSVWNGPHSLRRLFHASSTKGNPIRAAVAALLKQ